MPIPRISKVGFLNETEELDLRSRASTRRHLMGPFPFSNPDMNANWGHWELKQQQEAQV